MGEIRLGCMNCDIAHEDITEEEVDRLIGTGWREIDQIQTYEESLITYDNQGRPARLQRP